MAIDWSKIGQNLLKFGKGLGTVASSTAPIIASVRGLFGNSGGTSFWDSVKLMKLQSNLQKKLDQWTWQNEPSMTRAGLEAAGYNPVLAYMSSPASGGSVTSANAVEGNDAQAGASTLQSLTQLAQVGASIKNVNANTALQEEQAITESCKQLNLQADTDLKHIQTMLERGNLKWQEREKLVNYARTIMETKVMLMDARSRQVIAKAEDVQASATAFEKERYKRFMKNHPKQESFTYGLGQWTGAIGKIFSGNASTSVSHKR